MHTILKSEKLSMKVISAFFGVFLLIYASPVASQGMSQDIADSVPMYCRDSTAKFQPIVRTDYGKLKEEFIRQFGYRSSLYSTSATLGALIFSVDGSPKKIERIYYGVMPYNDGIALLHMHVRLNGVTEDLSGTEMCWRTFSIINVK